MASFTDEEIQAAVEALVQNTIARPYDTLGVRRTDLSFSEIQQAAAGVFLLYPKAPYYCLFLGAQAMLSTVSSEAQRIALLLEAIQSTGRAVVPIEDVSPLFNARAALDALGQAALGRSTGFQDITAIPAYQRFSTNVDRFVETAGPAIKDNGNVVRTPQEARRSLPGLVGGLNDAHASLVARVELLAKGAEDYSGLNLSALVAQSVIAKASAVLGAHADELLGLLPEQRLIKIRQVILDLLTAKSVVTTFGSFNGASSYYSLTGTGAPYSDANHPATPAVLRSALPGPYNLQLGSNILDLFLDGAGNVPRTLVSAVAVADGGNNKAVLTVVGAIPGDVLVGDVLYFRSGAQSGSKWIITTLLGLTVTAQGTVPAVASGAITIEVLPQPTVTIGLPYAFSPQLFGTRPEVEYTSGNGYIIGDGVNPIRPTGETTPENDELIVVINGVQFPVTLTLSASNFPTEATPRTAQEVCDDINVVTVPEGYIAEPYLNPRRYLGYFVQSIDAGISAHFDLLGGFGNLGSLGIIPGMLVNVLDGDVSQQGLWLITAVTATRATATNVLATPAIAQAQIKLEIGDALRAIKMRAIDPEDACDNLDTLGTTYTGNPDSSSVTFKCATLIGLNPGGVSTARKQTAKDISSAISTSSSLVTAAAVLAPSLEGLAARTEPTNSSRVTFSKFRGTATTVYGAPTLVATVAGALTAGVVAGDYLVERGGSAIGTLYQVTIVTDATVTATYLSGGAPATQATAFGIEIGHNPAVSPYDLIRIEDGPAEGDYYVLSQSGLDVALQSTLPINIDPATGQGIVLSISLGPEYVEVTSKTTTTASKIKARGDAEAKLFTHNGGTAGTSRYFRLPSKVKGLDVGDLFLRYTTQYNSPDSTLDITAVETDIITLSTAIPSDVTWAFGPTATVPFARLQPSQAFDFDSFKTELDAWVAQEEQTEPYFTDMNRLINPLIANTTPTGVAIGDALNKVKSLAAQLTAESFTAYGGSQVPLETILGELVIEQQPAVDALLRAFRDKGADRAVDYLLGGQFQAFFAMDQDDASYAGSMQKAMREVVRNDLAMKKTNRPDAKVSRLLSSTKGPDPDFDLSDAEVAVPDPVGQGDF